MCSILGLCSFVARLKFGKNFPLVFSPSSDGWLGQELCRSGAPHRAIELLEPAVSVQREANCYGSELFATSLGEGYWLAGEYEKATRTLRETLAIIERWGMRFHIGAAYRILGEMALSTDAAQAAIHFEHSIATLREINAEPELALAYAGYGRLHVQQGDVLQAHTYLNQALEIFERLGTLGEPEKVSQALSALSEG